MSNHRGSYIINNILIALDNYKAFDLLGKELTIRLMNDIRVISNHNDCNPSEILDEIGEKLKICYECWKYDDNLEYGVCEPCQKRWHN
jgi:hypothetical protein